MQRQEKCGQKTEVYSRVVGYFRPLAQWNAGKQSEFRDRKTFAVADDAEGDQRAHGADEMEKDQVQQQKEAPAEPAENPSGNQQVVISDEEYEEWKESIGWRG